MTRSTALALALVLGTGCAAAPPVAPAAPSASPGPLFRALFTETAGANLAQCEIDASGSLEAFPMEQGGTMLYASGHKDGCTGSFTVFVYRSLEPGRSYALAADGSEARVHFEQTCADDRARSWRSRSGKLSITALPDGTARLTLWDTSMTPIDERGAATGSFKALLSVAAPPAVARTLARGR
jgi:hypothetical protein